jgi:inorganic triphosphatase YgiF
MTVEVEAKLAAPDAAALASLPEIALQAGFVTGEVERVIVHDHYLDTEDLHLYRADWALRLRDLGTRQILALKSLTPPRAGISEREEREEPVTWTPRTGWTIPASALDGLPSRLADGSPFQRLFTLRQDRSVFPLAGAEGTNWEGFWCEASMDLVRWTARDGAPLEAYEAEFELKQGSVEQLRGCVQEIARRSGWNHASTSKFRRGLAAAGLTPT